MRFTVVLVSELVWVIVKVKVSSSGDGTTQNKNDFIFSMMSHGCNDPTQEQKLRLSDGRTVILRSLKQSMHHSEQSSNDPRKQQPNVDMNKIAPRPSASATQMPPIEIRSSTGTVNSPAQPRKMHLPNGRTIVFISSSSPSTLPSPSSSSHHHRHNQ